MSLGGEMNSSDLFAWSDVDACRQMMDKRRNQMLDDLEEGVTKVAATFKPQIQRLKDREDQVGQTSVVF
jgi:hypothetical protein